MTSVTETVLPIIRATREMLLPFYGKIEEVTRKTEHNHDVVTELDLKVETFLKEELLKLYPDIEFAGEEFGGGREAKRFWLCDPIDGTSHFIRGLPFCTVMLSLIEDGQVTFAVIYDFVNDIAYHAEKGKGAFANDEPIHVSKRPAKDAYLGYETHAEKEENLNKFLRLREFAPLFKALCSGYEHILVASGKLDGRVVFDGWGKDWDYAPGSLLIAEAGGIVANLGKRTYDYRNLDYIAANPEVLKALTEGSDAIFPIE